MAPTLQDRKRLIAILLFLTFLFSLLVVQFYKIQVVEGEKWEKAAKRQHQLSVVEPAKRGLFFSNTSIKKGHPERETALVVDIPKFHLFADPEAIPPERREEVANTLQLILSLTPAQKESVLEQLSKKSRSRKLILWLGREERDKVSAWWYSFVKGKKIAKNGLFFVADYKRSYPYGKLLGQVLHTLRDDKDEKTHESIPTGGLELTLNKYLAGKDGKRVILRSPRQMLDTGKIVQEPAHGSDVYLTINHTLQTIAEEEIEGAVKKAGGKGGWAIMMEPRTGEILAFAQYPFFEPAAYRKYFNDPKLERDTRVQALTDPYEPGSTMKPITLAIALKANAALKAQGKPPLFSPYDKVATPPTHFAGRGGKVLKDLHTHKALNMYMGLQKSSNVYMAKTIQRVIEQMGDKWYRDQLHDLFGFGVKTGIELPGESSGLLPLPGKTHPNGTLEWSKATPYSLAMGHNVLASSLQMLKCYAIFANGGFDVKPTLIRKIVKGGEVVLDHSREERVKNFKRLLEPEIVQEVVRAMRFATKPGGTARRADIPDYTEAGKTATSEKVVNGVYSKRNHISTFIGFAPVNEPKFVLLVAVDEPEYKYVPGVGKNQHGGVCCAPAFCEIGRRTLEYLGVPKDANEKKDWMDEVKKLESLYESWNH